MADVARDIGLILIGILMVLSIQPLQNILVANAASPNATSIDAFLKTVFPLFYTAFVLCYWCLAIYTIVKGK